MARGKAQFKGDRAWSAPRDFSSNLKTALREFCPPGIAQNVFIECVLSEARWAIGELHHQQGDVSKADHRIEIEKLLMTLADAEGMLRTLSPSVDLALGVDADPLGCAEMFTYAKQRNVRTAAAAPDGAGDTWTWTALDSDSKLLISYLVGKRDSEYCLAFMSDLASRTAGRFQLTTDGHKAYVEAVEDSFGPDVDFAQLVKQYSTPSEPGPERRYSPAVCTGAHKNTIQGNPVRAKVSTSHVERANLSMRMHMRRYTRLTNAFSKKFENHCHMVAIYTVFYNFLRIHKTLKVTPAQEARLTDKIWEWEDIIEFMDSLAPAPKSRGPYKRQISN